MNHPRYKGFTLVEILLTISLIILLATVALISVSGQIGKAQDAQARTAMAQLKRVFEEYYSDHNCYPPATWFDGPEDCHSGNLKPYLDSIPCDIHTQKPYRILTDYTGCQWFGLYTRLSQDTGNTYCVEAQTYNYFLGSDNAIPQVTCPLYYFCRTVGQCEKFDITYWNCTPGFADDKCTGSNNCNSYTGSCTVR